MFSLYSGDLASRINMVSDKIESASVSADNMTDESVTIVNTQYQEPEKNKKKRPQISRFEKSKRRKRTFSVITTIILWIISIVLLVFCASNLYQQFVNTNNYTGFFGIGNAIVVSDSMSPTIEKNDFIIYKQVDPSTLKKDDIIVYHRTYGNEPILIVHRLQSIEDGYAVTKGDNNSVADESFETSNIVGKMILKVPKIGLVLNALSTVYAAGALAILIAICMLIKIVIVVVQKKKTLKLIAGSKENQKAVETFFDI